MQTMLCQRFLFKYTHLELNFVLTQYSNQFDSVIEMSACNVLYFVTIKNKLRKKTLTRTTAASMSKTTCSAAAYIASFSVISGATN